MTLDNLRDKLEQIFLQQGLSKKEAVAKSTDFISLIKTKEKGLISQDEFNKIIQKHNLIESIQTLTSTSGENNNPHTEESNQSKKNPALISLLVDVVLPIGTTIILYNVATFFNGTVISDPANQKAISRFIGMLSILLIVWIIRGIIRFFKVASNQEYTLQVSAQPVNVVPIPKPTLEIKSEAAEIKQSDITTIKAVAKSPLFKKNTIKRSLRITLITIAVIIIILILTNPSYQDFQEYTPDIKTKNHYSLRKREHNYLIFSIYEITSYDYNEDYEGSTSSKKYFGVFRNFYPM